MSTLFKTQIRNIRKEAIELGYNKSTMNGYLNIWNSFVKWKNSEDLVYNELEYSKFLLDCYHFDVTSYNDKSKSRYQQLMRSKRILDDWDNYKNYMIKRILPRSLYNEYPSDWNITLNKYLDYCKNIQYNSFNTIKIKQNYLKCVLSYLYQNNILELKSITKNIVVNFINESIDKGNISKRRFFYILRNF